MAIISLLATIGYFEIFVAIFCFFVLAFQGRSSFIWNWPFLGMFPSLVFHIHRIHERSVEVLSRTRGTFLLKGLWFTNMDILGTVDPANVQYIMSANFTNFPKGRELRKIFDVLGDGIFSSDMDLWKNQRKLARALITHQRFHKCLTKISLDKVKNGLIPILELIAKEDRIVDLQDVFKRFTFDTTCKLLTGFESCCLSLEFPEVPFLKAMDDAKYVVSIRYLLPESIWKLQKWLGVGPEMQLRKASDVLDRVIGEYILMKREELSRVEKCKENEEGFDLLTPYIINDGERTSGLKFDKFLRDTFLNFMFAGHDTVSSGLTWFIWLVSTHPEVEKNIREELRAIIPPEEAEKWRLFTADELKNVIYLHAALCESLRLYPPVAFQHKTPLEPDILPSGHHVHPNMRVMIPLYAMGRMESIWGKDASEFKPHRWISDRGTINYEPSYKFFSFNAGPRTCLGKEAAFTQMKVVVATIIHNYQIEMVKGHVVYPNVSVMLYMKHGFKVRVKRKWA
ncbi:alkane hydroxylase MAH1-like [Nicotiana tabacum]|uniref:Alkane hydroxylase MAH1-like n=1 Tax=Nicotiana tabacum TaxID=4097 RepID=A0A1S4D044_TOBAC|nr:PREDICTED: alkane hydroxylase MAH1-like [Nicotiana tabacum]